MSSEDAVLSSVNRANLAVGVVIAAIDLRLRAGHDVGDLVDPVVAANKAMLALLAAEDSAERNAQLLAAAAELCRRCEAAMAKIHGNGRAN